MRDPNFADKMEIKEKAAWTSLKSVFTGFLENNRCRHARQLKETWL